MSAGSDSRPPAAEPPFPPARVAWYTVAVLSAMYMLSILDRYVIAFLVGPIKRDLGVTDFQIGMLQGIAFALFYSIAGLPIGWLVDRYTRRWLVFWGVLCWTVATAASGLARSFWHLFGARVAVGVGEATLNPAAFSIIADSFPRHRLTFALSLYVMGATLGAPLAFALSGILVEYYEAAGPSHLPLVGAMHSWQLVFLTIGLPGVLMAFLMLSFPEPARRGAPPDAAAPVIADVLAFARTHWRFLLWHHAAFTLFNVMITGVGSWEPTFMARNFHWSMAEIGIGLGAASAAGSVVGMVAGGRLIDAWFTGGRTDAQMRWFVYASLLALGIGLAMIFSGNPWGFLAGKFAFQAVVATYPSASGAAIQIVAPNRLRGRLMAFYLMVSSIIGTGFGPMLTAAFTDFVFRDDAMVGWSMALVLVLCLPLAALCFALGCRHMRTAVAAAG